MRPFLMFLLAVLACISLGSCAILGGGSDSEPVETTESVDGGNNNRVAEPETIDEDTPPEPDDSDDPAEEPETVTMYSTVSLNVRAGRGTSFPVIAGLSYGEQVEAGNIENGWFELFSDGQSVGFAVADYLTAEKPAPISEEAVPRASRDTGLFGVGVPTGSALMENVPLTEDADARQEYRVPMSASEIRDFFVRELASLGWNPEASQTETAINYRKGDLSLTVEINSNGQRFTLTGGRR